MQSNAAARPLPGSSAEPAVAQARSHSSSLQALSLLARLHHIAADPGLLAHELGLAPSTEASDAELLLAAKHLGLKAKISRTSGDRLSLAPLPALARIRPDEGAERWVLLAQ